MGGKPGLVIIGGGQAGFQLAVSARAAGYEEPITMVSAERELPYNRPPLSKAYMLGKQTRDDLLFKKSDYYGANRIEMILNTPVTAIDRHEGQVRIGESRLPFDHVAVATGARNRLLPIPGADLDGVLGLRDLREADEVRSRMAAAERVVVIGGGFIGLEFAAVARQLGKDVTIVEAQGRLMARSVAEAVSRFFLAEHERRGVRVLLGAGVRAIVGGDGKAAGVELGDGSRLPAELILYGIGVLPNDDLAAAAGLAVANGVVVNGDLRTSDERIFALGDCAAFPTEGGGLQRIESVKNAVDQGKHVARAILGETGAYSTTPWFWSDQYDLKLQTAGIAAGADCAVTRGDPESRAFSVFLFRDGALIAVDSINRPVDHVLARKLLAARSRVTPEQVRDPGVDLKHLV